MTELDETLLASRALYARYKELEARYNALMLAVNKCYAHLNPPLPYRMRKRDLLRCMDSASAELVQVNAQIMQPGGAGDSEHEQTAQQTGKVSRNATPNINRTILMRGRGAR